MALLSIEMMCWAVNNSLHFTSKTNWNHLENKFEGTRGRIFKNRLEVPVAQRGVGTDGDESLLHELGNHRR